MFTGLLTQTAPEEESGKLNSQLNWSEIKNLSLAQKVRLAILGNMGARSVLIRDSKKIVYMAVMKSPRLTDKEIVTFAKNKALSDQIIGYIARRKEWLKSSEVRKALVFNPKCPTNVALRLVSTLSERDLKALKKNKEIPAYIMQAAARLVQMKEDRRNR